MESTQVNADEAPKIYGDYEVVRAIGKGKFAVVYRAKRISDGEIVALKRINVDAIDPVSREKCLKEIRLLQSLDHPNIIKYLDSFISENDLVIVIEWAAAGDLKRQLKKAQERGVGFEERLIWKYFSQICDAMQHMHEKRIMHRDLKPANIFLTLDGTIKVGDLGLSRELSEHTIQAHSKVGTPLYMSPEVLRGDGYDFKSDVWSLGCLLYELAMLKSPFRSEGLNLYSLFQKISQGDYQPLPDNYSEQLRSLAYSMISTKSEDRPELTAVCAIASNMRMQTARRAGGDQAAAAAPAASTASTTQSTISAEQATAPAPAPAPSRTLTQRPQEITKQRTFSDADEMEETKADLIDKPRRKPNAKTATVDNDRHADAKASPTSFEFEVNKDKDRSQSGRREDGREDKSASNRTNDRHSDWEREKPKDKLPPGKFDEVDDDEGEEKDGGHRGRGRGGDGDDFRSSGPAKQRQAEVKSSDRRAANSSAPVPSAAGPSGWDEYNVSEIQPAPPQPQAKAVPYSRPKKGAVAESKQAEDSAVSRRERPSASDASSRLTTPSNGEDVQATAPAADRRVDSALSEHLLKASEAFALMDVLYGNLLLLDYPMQGGSASVSGGGSGGGNGGGGNEAASFGRRLLPIHFACDLSLFGRVAGYGKPTAVNSNSSNEFLQFRRMVEVASWLVNIVGGPAGDLVRRIDLMRDAPITVAKQLLGAAQAAGVPAQSLAEVLPTALLPGYGDKVCTLLLALCDVAIPKSGRAEKQMVYPNLDYSLQHPADSTEDDEEPILESSIDAGNDFLAQETEDADGALAASMLLPTVDPLVWKAETERVAPLLSQARQAAGGHTGWGDNLRKITDHSKVWTDDEPIADPSRPVDKSEPAPRLSMVNELLGLLVRDMSEGLKTVRRGEGVLTNLPFTHSLSNEFGSFKKTALELEKRTADASKRLEQFSNQLSELDEKLEVATESLSSKTESAGGSDSSSSVVRMKEAIKAMKDESSAMHLRIGLLSTTLLTKQVVSANEKSVERRQKRRAANLKGIRTGVTSAQSRRAEEEEDNEHVLD